ncbi:MAG: F0F1 ATP synthase subunit epsilon [Myxococcota bacterium]
MSSSSPTDLHVEIVTPRKVAWKGTALDVQAPGELGEFGVLPRHIPFLTVLAPGVVKVRTAAGLLRFQVGAGFAEAGPDRVVLLTDSCDEIK